jgi:ketosteroid isomerase-like protein
MTRDTRATVSQAHVDTHMAGIVAFNERDLEALLGWLAEDIRLHSRFTGVDTRVFEGHAGIREWQAGMVATWESIVMDIERIDAPSEELTLAIGTLRAKGQESGVEVSEPMAQLVRWRDGKGVEITMYRSEAEALEAAGVA